MELRKDRPGPRARLVRPLSYALFAFCSKTALLEGLEVDQYMLGILIYIQK